MFLLFPNILFLHKIKQGVMSKVKYFSVVYFQNPKGSEVLGKWVFCSLKPFMVVPTNSWWIFSRRSSEKTASSVRSLPRSGIGKRGLLLFISCKQCQRVLTTGNPGTEEFQSSTQAFSQVSWAASSVACTWAYMRKQMGACNGQHKFFFLHWLLGV